MGIQEICDLLKEKYPEFLSARDIIEELNVTKPSVTKSLRSIRKREEVQLELVQNKKYSPVFITKYRIKPEE
jgi:DNA-binding MarR family transcriptional regulator